jgi:DNA helicase-2/ATP-dependent DNA helicase PcrA
MILLAGARHNICAVGVKTSRSTPGAARTSETFSNLNFPEAKIIRLEQNYRSTQNILQAASAVVATISNARKESLDFAAGWREGRLLRGSDGENEALFAADYIAKYLREVVDQGENARAAVALRTNSVAARSRKPLRVEVSRGGWVSFYERTEIKDMISYLKVIHNPDDSISLLRVINTRCAALARPALRPSSTSR